MKKLLIASMALAFFASCSKSADKAADKVEVTNDSISANEWNAQKVYYRIKATDKSGKVTYSTVQSVMETKP